MFQKWFVLCFFFNFNFLLGSFLGGSRGLNLKSCIYYALSLSTELSSQGHLLDS